MADNLIEAFLETSNEARFQVIEQVRQELTRRHDNAYEAANSTHSSPNIRSWWSGQVYLTNELLSFLHTLETTTQSAVPDDAPNNPTTHNPT